MNTFLPYLFWVFQVLVVIGALFEYTAWVYDSERNKQTKSPIFTTVFRVAVVVVCIYLVSR